MALLPIKKTLTPDSVASKLFYFRSQAHFNHLQTTSFSRHKALDKLYKGLQDFEDDICELLLGYIAPKRLSKLEIPPISNISDEQLVEALIVFADDLYNYGEETKWWALSNRAADLSDLATTVKYFLTLK